VKPGFLDAEIGGNKPRISMKTKHKDQKLTRRTIESELIGYETPGKESEQIQKRKDRGNELSEVPENKGRAVENELKTNPKRTRKQAKSSSKYAYSTQ
jgi:hypothetical protein